MTPSWPRPLCFTPTKRAADSRQIARVDIGGKSDIAIIGELQHFIFRCEGLNGGDRSENLLTHDSRVLSRTERAADRLRNAIDRGDRKILQLIGRR